MRTHPIPVVTTVPTGQHTLAAVSTHWLVLASVGFILTLAVATALAALTSAAHRTIPTLGRALWLRDVVLAPAAVVCCTLLVSAVLGTSHELASKRDSARVDAVVRTQSALAEQSGTGWGCQAVDVPDPAATTVSCIPLP